MTSPGRSAEKDCEMLPRRRHMPSSTVISGVMTATVLFMLITNCMEISLIGSEVYEPGWTAQAAVGTDRTSCECLLDLHCPRYGFKYPQETNSICKIHSFPFRSTEQCLQWRERHLSAGRTHLVFLGDLRLLYLYRFIRDHLMSQTERIEGPAYCASIERNWTHAYVNEEGGEQPARPCRHLAINALAKLEYVWTPDSQWPGVLEQMLHRCHHGSCPSLIVVSSRLDLALKGYRSERELWLGRTNIDVHQALPLLQRLRARGVHVWWKPQENLLDMGIDEDVGSYNEVVQMQNLKIMKILSTSTVPVWTSADAIAWMHHNHCENTAPAATTLTPDYRCQHPYYLGNWAQQQYMDIILNFLCGRAPAMALNPCCAGWA